MAELNGVPADLDQAKALFDPALELGHLGANAEPQVLVTTRPAAHIPCPELRLQSAIYCRDMPDVKHVGLFGSLQHISSIDDFHWPDEHPILDFLRKEYASISAELL